MNLTYRDTPILRAVGFTASDTGQSWFGKDTIGQEWQAFEDDDGRLHFVELTVGGYSGRMDRERFDNIFAPTTWRQE